MFADLFPPEMQLNARLLLVLLPLIGLIWLIAWRLIGISSSHKYLDQFLQPGEQIQFETRLHPIMYFSGFLFVAAGVGGMMMAGFKLGGEGFAGFLSVLMFISGSILLLVKWVQRRTTEIAITDRRVIYKTGLIWRDTIEMNRTQIESVEVSQSILGRVLDYGTITLRGTGLGIEPIRQIEAPLKFRGFVRSAP
jgi:Bacterial PH domain